MSHLYLDASALVKRYSSESGSDWIRSLMDPLSGHTFMLSEITLAEVAAALAVKHRIQGGSPNKSAMAHCRCFSVTASASMS